MCEGAQNKKERILNSIEIKEKITEQVLNDKNNELLKKNEENHELEVIKQNNIYVYFFLNILHLLSIIQKL